MELAMMMAKTIAIVMLPHDLSMITSVLTFMVIPPPYLPAMPWNLGKALASNLRVATVCPRSKGFQASLMVRVQVQRHLYFEPEDPAAVGSCGGV